MASLKSPTKKNKITVQTNKHDFTEELSSPTGKRKLIKISEPVMSETDPNLVIDYITMTVEVPTRPEFRKKKQRDLW